MAKKPSSPLDVIRSPTHLSRILLVIIGVFVIVVISQLMAIYLPGLQESLGPAGVMFWQLDFPVITLGSVFISFSMVVQALSPKILAGNQVYQAAETHGNHIESSVNDPLDPTIPFIANQIEELRKREDGQEIIAALSTPPGYDEKGRPIEESMWELGGGKITGIYLPENKTYIHAMGREPFFTMGDGCALTFRDLVPAEMGRMPDNVISYLKLHKYYDPDKMIFELGAWRADFLEYHGRMCSEWTAAAGASGIVVDPALGGSLSYGTLIKLRFEDQSRIHHLAAENRALSEHALLQTQILTGAAQQRASAYSTQTSRIPGFDEADERIGGQR